MRRTGIYLQLGPGFADFIACIWTMAVALAHRFVVRSGVVGIPNIVVVVIGE